MYWTIVACLLGVSAVYADPATLIGHGPVLTHAVGSLDSAVIKSDRIGGNFAYSVHESGPVGAIYAAPAPIALSAPVAAPIALSAPVAAPIALSAPYGHQQILTHAGHPQILTHPGHLTLNSVGSPVLTHGGHVLTNGGVLTHAGLPLPLAHSAIVAGRRK